MGIEGPVLVDENAAPPSAPPEHKESWLFRRKWRVILVVLVVAGIVYLGCVFSPPSLMDDVDAVQAQISRNMISSGDWVTARLDGVIYLEKAPLIYWIIAIFYKIFGPFDWAARLPIALSTMGLCGVTAAFGIWAFGKRVGFYAGLVLATCIGLFLFTRILIPDVMLTLAIALSMWAFLRVVDEEEKHPRLWAYTFAACMGVGLLLKSLIAVVFPLGAAFLYLLLTHQLFSGWVWKRLHPFTGTLILLAIAVPWHVLATLRNPPYFAWTLKSGPGLYHGFLWFFFINEQFLRFLNMRYPRDYNTVPRLWFWLFHFIWLFPFSVYLPAVAKLSYKPVDRAGRTRLLALCWTGIVLVFFTFSTTQEYYSMPCYPALALLLGCAMTSDSPWIKRGSRVLAVMAGLCAAAVFAILFMVRGVPSPGDISNALVEHSGGYTLALDHMKDLTLHSFAYLRFPLWIAGIAFLIGALGSLQKRAHRVYLAAALMMVLFLHAARVAMITFDPYLSSRPLAEAIKKSPPGTLIIDHHYYTFSSVFFYLNTRGYLLNGRFNNLVYGSYAPGAPPVFIDDAQFSKMWQQSQRYYIVAMDPQFPRFEKLIAPEKPIVVISNGGKFVLTNHPLDSSVQGPSVSGLGHSQTRIARSDQMTPKS
jgi:4-amino-4-deoxy-L-arabinose transferase-like glycosyltransferase